MRPVPAEPVPFSTPRAWALAVARARPGGDRRHPDQRDPARARLRPAVGRGRRGVLRAGRGGDRPGAAARRLHRAARAAAAGGHRALVHPQLHPPVRARRQGGAIQAARHQPLPAQPVDRAPAHGADRPGRAMGRARRRPRDVRPARRRSPPHDRAPQARRARDAQHAGAHREGAAHADRAAAASRRTGGGGARQSRRARADHGRVRVRPAGRQSGRSPRASTTTSWSSCSRTSSCTWRCAPTTAPRAPAGSSSTTRTTTSSTTCCASELGVATIPAGGLDMPGAREKSAEQIVIEMRRNGDFISSRTPVWDGEVTVAGRVFGPQAAGSGGDARRRRQRRRARRQPRARDVSRRCRGPGPPRQGDRRACRQGLALGKAMAHEAQCRGRGSDGRRCPAGGRRAARHLLARRGRWRCRPGSRASCPASAPSCGRRAAAPTATTW